MKKKYRNKLSKSTKIKLGTEILEFSDNKAKVTILIILLHFYEFI
jgi:hypothetical protein